MPLPRLPGGGQRVPVRSRLDSVPPGTQLGAGMTATVEVDPARPAG